MYVANENGPTYAHQQASDVIPQAALLLQYFFSWFSSTQPAHSGTPRREKEESLSEAGVRIGYHCIMPWLSSAGFI